MKVFLRLFWEELKGQRVVFAVAAGLALLSFVLGTVLHLDIGAREGGTDALISLLFLLVAPWALGAPWLAASSTGAIPEGDWRLFASPLLARLLVVVLGAWLPMGPEILATFQREPGEFGRPSPADIPEALAQWILLALAIFVLVQAGHFLVRDRSWRSLLDLAAILLVLAMFRFSAGLTGPEEARLTLLMAFIGVWSASGLFGAWRSFKAGPPIAQAHRRYSLSMICSLLVLGAGTMLTAFLVSTR